MFSKYNAANIIPSIVPALLFAIIAISFATPNNDMRIIGLSVFFSYLTLSIIHPKFAFWLMTSFAMLLLGEGCKIKGDILNHGYYDLINGFSASLVILMFYALKIILTLLSFVGFIYSFILLIKDEN